MNECLWQPCAQEPTGGGSLCYFHHKRAQGLLTGLIPGVGLAPYSEPPARVRELIAEMRGEDDDD